MKGASGNEMNKRSAAAQERLASIESVICLGKYPPDTAQTHLLIIISVERMLELTFRDSVPLTATRTASLLWSNATKNGIS